MQGKKILITGICGFLGSNLLAKIRDKNDVVGVDNFEYSSKEKSIEILKDIEFIEGDVSEESSFKKLPKDFDFIFHFGSPSSIVLFKKKLHRCYTETVLSCLNIFEFAKETNVKKVVIPSSGSVYAGNELPHSENILPKPLNSYAAAKMACESIASSYRDFVDFTCLRIFAGYGPGEERKGEFASVVYLFMNSISRGEAPTIFGNGMQSRDFVYVNDVTNAIIKCAENNYTGILNVGSGISTTFNDLVKIINKILNKNVNPIYIEKEKNYVDLIKADTTLSKKILEINLTPLEDGIKKFSEYLNLI